MFWSQVVKVVLAEHSLLYVAVLSYRPIIQWKIFVVYMWDPFIYIAILVVIKIFYKFLSNISFWRYCPPLDHRSHLHISLYSIKRVN